MLYQALRKTVNSKPTLIPYPSDVSSYIKTNDDYYTSLYQYSPEHKEIYEKTGTLAGIKNTTTDKLFFDFDSKNDLELARNDTLEVANRLIKEGVPEEAITAHYTGSKGFSI